MHIKRAAVCLFAAALAIGGCAAARFQVGRPWSPGEGNLFDDGVDLVQDLESLSGQWAYEQEKALDQRVGRADLVALVEIASVQTATALDAEIGKRIQVSVVEIVHGAAPDRQLALVSEAESPGYPLVLRYENRLTGRFFLFARWFLDDQGQVAGHFHLSPGSEAMAAAVHKRVRARERQEALVQLEEKR